MHSVAAAVTGGRCKLLHRGLGGRSKLTREKGDWGDGENEKGDWGDGANL